MDDSKREKIRNKHTAQLRDAHRDLLIAALKLGSEDTRWVPAMLGYVYFSLWASGEDQELRLELNAKMEEIEGWNQA